VARQVVLARIDAASVSAHATHDVALSHSGSAPRC